MKADKLQSDSQLYKLLNIRRTATKEEIELAYKRAMARASALFGTDHQRAIERLKQIDQAFAILSDPSRRSSYDALRTYNVLQNHAWKRFHINQSILPRLESFWAKQHTNNQLVRRLDFDRFIPEYDLLWYAPFYQEFYHKVVKDKQKRYLPTKNHVRSARVRAVWTLAVATLFLAAGLIMFFVFGRPLWTILLIISGGLGVVSGILQVKQYKILKDSAGKAQARIVDKWIEVEPCLVGSCVRLRYYLAFRYDGKVYYQRVPAQVFFKNKVGAGTFVRYFDGGVPAPFIEI